MRRLVKSFYTKFSGLWSNQSGPAGCSKGCHRKSWWFSTVCLFTTTIRSFHWSDLKLLCTTRVAEASSSELPISLLKLRMLGWVCCFITSSTGPCKFGAGMRHLWSETTLLDLLSNSVIKPVLGMVVMVWDTTSLWAWSSMSMLEPERYHRRMIHTVAYDLYICVLYLHTADSLTSLQTALTCLGEVASSRTEVPLLSLMSSWELWN